MAYLSSLCERVVVSRRVRAQGDPGQLGDEDGARLPRRSSDQERGDEPVRLVESCRVAVLSA